jgi:hypothetical protein
MGWKDIRQVKKLSPTLAPKLEDEEMAEDKTA